MTGCQAFIDQLTFKPLEISLPYPIIPSTNKCCRAISQNSPLRPSPHCAVSSLTKYKALLPVTHSLSRAMTKIWIRTLQSKCCWDVQPWDTMLWNNYRKNHFLKEISCWLEFKMILIFIEDKTELGRKRKNHKSQVSDLLISHLLILHLQGVFPVNLPLSKIQKRFVCLCFPFNKILKEDIESLIQTPISWQQTTVIQMTGAKAFFPVRLTGRLFNTMTDCVWQLIMYSEST